MDANRFDNLTKALAQSRSRRTILGLLGAAVGGLLGGASGALAAPPPDKPSRCYGEGSSCTNAKQCCSGICTNRRCAAPVPQCVFPTDCPGSDTECRTRTCLAGVCGFANAPFGTRTNQQTSGDCKQNVCDGAGQVTSIPDNDDLPNDDKGCTDDTCVGGNPVHNPKPAGTGCGDGNGTVCNETGTCVGCLTKADCPGQDTECQQRTCNAGTCGVDYTPQGTPTSQQIPGDCRREVCDGAGGVTSVPDNTDVIDDGNQCTTDTCVNGFPNFAPVAGGSPCNQFGGRVCNSTGQCVECLTGAHCASGFCSSAGVCVAPPCESMPGVGTACFVGIGACRRQGTFVCTADGLALVCNAVPGQPSPEICNNVDDDCDGLVDEGVTCPQPPNATAACMSGACRITGCNFGFADCNGNPADGCETNTMTDENHCGFCGRTCVGPAVCETGNCCTPAGSTRSSTGGAPCCPGSTDLFGTCRQL